jgi:hypothetical protein
MDLALAFKLYFYGHHQPASKLIPIAVLLMDKEISGKR